MNLDDAAIDSTRILPFPCSTIDVLDVTRDLPPFPTPMQVLETYVEEEPSDRKWNAPYAVPPEADDPGHSRADMEELFCRVQSCKTFGCAGHGERSRSEHSSHANWQLVTERTKRLHLHVRFRKPYHPSPTAQREPAPLPAIAS